MNTESTTTSARFKMPIGEVRNGYKMVVNSDDRPSEQLLVTVAEVHYQLYSFQGWYEIIDTDGNHWQFNNSDIVDVES